MPPEFERKLEDLTDRLAAAEREIERKDQLIEALKKQLFGRKSERIDPDQ